MADRLYKFDAQGNIEQLGFDTGGWIFPCAGVFKAQLVDENASPTATHENNVKALEYMVSYAEKYGVAKINQFLEGFEEIGNPMLVGKQAIAENGPWFEGVVLRDKPDFRWTVWPIPRPAWLDGHGQASGGDIPVIVSGTKHPEEAWQWVHYLSGVVDPKAYATLWTIGGYPHMPTSEEVATGPAFDDIRLRFPKFVEYIEDFYNADWVFTPPKTPIAKFYFDRLGSWVERARLLEVTPKEAMEGLQAEVTTEWDNWLATH